MHKFDEAIALTMTSENVFTGRVGGAYGNMVGPFGGLTAATLLNAVMQHPQCLGEPISLTVNFAGPLAYDEFTIEAEPVRTNNSTQHWVILQKQAGKVVTSATAFFALRKDTWAEQELIAPTVESAQDLTPLASAKQLNWLNNYDMRFIQGGLDYDRGEPLENSLSRLWIRDHPQREIDFPALAAIGDVFFPRTFIRHQTFMPAGTVSITLQFHTDKTELAEVRDEFLLGEARASRVSKNYFDQTARFWSTQGSLLLSSHQMVYFKM